MPPMPTTDAAVRIIALVSPGAMGSAVGGCLARAGFTVLTSLKGRSAASSARAAQAGMIHADDATLARADLFLSIVPPGEASALVERFLPHFEQADVPPLFVDANALNPDSKRALADRLAQAGCDMVDGAIIGPPPGGSRPTIFHLSGAAAPRALALGVPGFLVEVLDGPVGAAAALKMCYGGINKGVVGLAAALLRAAERHGAADALRAEMQRSMPDLFARFGRQVPDMIPKAHRWVAEMEEIAAFLSPDDAAGALLYTGMAGEFAQVAAQRSDDGPEIATLLDAVRAD